MWAINISKALEKATLPLASGVPDVRVRTSMIPAERTGIRPTSEGLHTLSAASCGTFRHERILQDPKNPEVALARRERRADTVARMPSPWSARAMASTPHHDVVIHVVDSPVGALRLSAHAQGITGLEFASSERPDRERPSHPVLARLVDELHAYFAGALRRFTVPLAPEGSPFEVRVWQALVDIPFGETRSYLDVARRVGGKNHTRAVGGANGRNPIGIVIPCHRVIASDGTLGGYSGGLDKKRALLTLEGRRDVMRTIVSPTTTLTLPFVDGR